MAHLGLEVKTPSEAKAEPVVDIDDDPPMDYALWSLVFAKGRKITFSGIYRRWDGACVCGGDEMSTIQYVMWMRMVNKATIVAENGEQLCLTWKRGKWFSSGHGMFRIVFPARNGSDDRKEEPMSATVPPTQTAKEIEECYQTMLGPGGSVKREPVAVTPDRTHMYSFCLYPQEYQPSGPTISTLSYGCERELMHISIRGVEEVAKLLAEPTTSTDAERTELALKCDVQITSRYCGDFEDDAS